MEGNGIIFRNEIKKKHPNEKTKKKPYSSTKHSWLNNVSILEPKSSGPWGGGEVTLVGCSLTAIQPGVMTARAPECLV